MSNEAPLWRRACSAWIAGVLLLGGCSAAPLATGGAAAPTSAPRHYVGGGGSLVPNAGMSAHAGATFHRGRFAELSAEMDATVQFLDDEALADDGNPAAGVWTQAQIGLKAVFHPRNRYRPFARAGFAWAEARGEPNIVQTPGTYTGAYIAGGSETSLGPNLTIGPEVGLMILQKEGNFDHGLVPQFCWKVSWWPQGSGRECSRFRGDLYAGAVASVVPGLGGGLELGQVVHRAPACTLSFEASGIVQALREDVFGASGDARLARFRGGLKASFQPQAARHWVLRAGLAWLRNTADTDFLGEAADRVGGFASVGYEWDVGRRLRVGPELQVVGAFPEGRDDLDIVPQLDFHVIYRF